MSWLAWLILGAGLWLVWAIVVSRIQASSVRDDLLTGFVLVVVRAYARLVHGLRIEGMENVPTGRRPGTLIIVSNHTAGIDPMLVQASLPFEVNWMMAEDMRLAWAEPLWKWLGIIFVDRKAGGTMSARLALRHLEKGGVLGIFPEGRIERPARHVLPFLHGVGMLAARMRAPILPVVIEGTPDTPSAWASLWTPSRARVRFMPVIKYDRAKPGEITDDLRKRYLEWTGWPALDDEARATERADTGGRADGHAGAA